MRAYLAAVAIMGHSARDGNAQTRLIAAPLLDADGQRQRGKGGVILRGGELIENPGARYVQTLDAADLAQSIGLDGDNRLHRSRAVKAFEAGPRRRDRS